MWDWRVGFSGHGGLFDVGVPNEHNFRRGARKAEFLLGH